LIKFYNHNISFDAICFNILLKHKKSKEEFNFDTIDKFIELIISQMFIY
jgi:hypothetical protein